MLERKVQGHMLFRSANISSVDVEKRTVDMVFTTGFKGKRTDFWSDKQWFEELAVDQTSMRMDRLNSGAPLLDAHSQYGIGSVLGVVEKAWIQDGKGMASVRFSQRDDVSPIFKDVQDGIVRNISVGYRVYKWEDVTVDDDQITTYRATDWEPYELSLVPIGFDPGAQTRGASRQGAPETFDMTIISTRLDGKSHKRGQKSMDPEETPAAVVPAVDAKKIAEDAARIATEAERKRCTDIRLAVRAARLDDKVGDDLIARAVSADAARAEIIEQLAKRDDGTPIRSVRVDPGAQDEIAVRRDGITDALMHRAFQKGELNDAARKWRGLTLMEMARSYLEEIGVRTVGMSRNQLATEALRVRGYHSTSDFPNILANVANKSLLTGYERLMAQQTFRPFVTVKTAPDFKQVSRVRLGEVPSLELVPEGAEVKRGTIGESKEVYNLATYAKILAITREVIINDDLDAFTDIPSKFGAAVARLESDIVYAIINGNPNMGDGVALFNAAHGNLESPGTVISVDSIGAGRAKMRKQKGLSGKDFLNVAPAYLLVPAALETKADQFVSQAMLANLTTSINPFAGRLKTISDPRLDANSAISWYLVADPATGVDIIELLYLDGQTGPQMQTDVGFDINGVQMKAMIDIAAKAIDWRGLYKNPGA